jgi:4-amino-4-deoxy-L-arabinose transferase-like glycosyltransferase
VIDETMNTNSIPPRGATAARATDALSAPRTLTWARVLGVAWFIVLSGMITTGAILRLWHINDLGYNSDEAVYSGQAAALAGDPELSRYFPIFRAHPMVFQYLLSLAFSVFGVHDIIGRTMVAVIGLVTLLLVYKAGADLYGRWTGVIAASLMAVMPYHVIVTRQVLLDGPLTFATTLTLLMLIRYALTGRAIYLMAVGSGLGLVFLTKETGFVLAAAAFAFLSLRPEIRIRFWPLVAAGVCMMIPIVMFPVSISLAGRSDTAQSYLVWQLLRRSNHPWDFFPRVVPPAMGWLVIACAVAGMIALRNKRTWRETLLLCWIALPIVVFQLWPVKGFQYLLPIAPAVCILAARTLVEWRPWQVRRSLPFPLINTIATAIVILSLLLPASRIVNPANTQSGLAGAGGIPGVREAGLWIDENLPEGAVLVAIGPSMANMIQFYGHREAYGLSVSTNPLHRNPSYRPLANPDAAFRYGDAHYLVWDVFSANRSEFFDRSIRHYIEKYDATEVYSFTAPTPTAPAGSKIIIIYEVRP